MSFSSRLSSSGLPTEDNQVLTVLVGEGTDPASVTPCGRTGIEYGPTHPRVPRQADGDDVVVLGDDGGGDFSARERTAGSNCL